MRSIVIFILSIFVVSAMTGCAHLVKKDDKMGTEYSDIPLPASSQVQALKDESGARYLMALKYWKDSRQTIDNKISSLAGHLKKTSEEHARKGVSYYEERRGGEAAWEFFEALRYDSSNKEALEYLKKRYRADRFVLYIVKEGDTFEHIAENVYGNFTEAFVVTHFSDATKKEAIVAGAVLKLPLLDSFYSQALLDYKRDIAIARKLFNEQQYKKLLPLAEKILKRHPEDQEASYLVNTALVRMANKLRKQGKYEEAIGYLARVNPSFKDVKKEINEIRKLENEKLAKEKQLANTQLFNRGQDLYAQGRYLEAFKVYQKIDPDFENLGEAITDVTKKLEMQADIHYKEGVKYFIADNLTDAIVEWEKTLQLSPGHRRAINYITKARRLLEKFKAIN